jgi:hypothetical protein
MKIQKHFSSLKKKKHKGKLKLCQQMCGRNTPERVFQKECVVLKSKLRYTPEISQSVHKSSFVSIPHSSMLV